MTALTSDWLRHFYFFSATTEWFLAKLDRKQDLNALYQVCVFPAYRKTKMAAPASDWRRHFRLLLCNHWTGFNLLTWQEARSQLRHQVWVFQAQWKTKFVFPASDWLQHFQLPLCNCLTDFKETLQEASTQHPQSSLCFFWVDHCQHMFHSKKRY